MQMQSIVYSSFMFQISFFLKSGFGIGSSTEIRTASTEQRIIVLLFTLRKITGEGKIIFLPEIFARALCSMLIEEFA